MKSQAECERIIRGLVSAAIKHLKEPETLDTKSADYHRISAQLTLVDLMEVLPAELGMELREDLDEAYHQALQCGSPTSKSALGTLDGYITLEPGKVYTHTNGGQYERIDDPAGSLIQKYGQFDAQLRRKSDRWVIVAHGTRMTEDSLIHWDYSTGGHWELN